jgi:ribonucleoside-diphosphate reductase alpha chain
MDSQIETGTPYILFKDNINRQSNQSNVGIIRSSNLCAEITEYSDAKEYACCVLASIALPNFVSDETRVIDYERLEEVVEVIVRNLNRVIDINYYPVPETERSNKRHRPLGIGVQGLADLFIKMRVPFDSEEARLINRDLFESIYYFAIKASVKIAREFVPYSTFEGSPISRGEFQFDLWGVQPSGRYNWSELRREIAQYGIRNSLLIALMPTASTSQILGNNECIEPYTSNIYSRRTIAGDFIIVNKYLVRDLMGLGLWSTAMKNKIIANNGSVVNIEEIPENIKQLYKTAWEIKQKAIIQLSIDRGPFVCQTTSMNLFFQNPDYNKLTSAFFYGWKNRIKTGCYYIRSQPTAEAQKFTIEPENINKNMNENNKQVAICTLDNREACQMCSS